MNISLVVHNIRSTHNVGAFFRTCDGLGVSEIIFSGYTPYPRVDSDSRLPHLADKITRQIHKTALGAESYVTFRNFKTLEDSIATLRNENYTLIALEQHQNSRTPAECRDILRSSGAQSIALFLGNEIHGIDNTIASSMDYIIEIPMHGKKESFNVSIAAAIALYELMR